MLIPDKSCSSIAFIYQTTVLLPPEQVMHCLLWVKWIMKNPYNCPTFLKPLRPIGNLRNCCPAQAPPMLPLSPNQAWDLVILEYKLEVEAKGVIKIVDVNGIIVQTVQIYPISDQVSIVTRDWKQGIYLVSLKAGGTLLE